MTNRPAIPADIKRQVLRESGNRCAVCGTPGPLEFAHIVPWNKSREHKADNLICLCANCHSRADKEKWGEKQLREYKDRPWVLVRFKEQLPGADLDSGPLAELQEKETIDSGLEAGPNPFVYGRPVQPEEFVDREDDLRAIFNRLRNGESTAVVGEPHIGKTSLLCKLADVTTQRVYLGDYADLCFVVLIDLYDIPSDYSPISFWERALGPLRDCSGRNALAQWLRQIAEHGYQSDSLEELFDYLQEQDLRLVLFLDEFERLLSHQNFQDFAFFATLRKLNSSKSFSCVTASRLPLNELNEQGYRLPGSGGSPLFNTLVEIRVRPFSEEAVDTLLGRAGDKLSVDDRRFIRRVAGRHPFLVQAMAAAMLEASGDDRQIRAAEHFYERISSHFDDLWRTMDDRTRTTAVALSLVELGGRALGESYAYGEIEHVKAFGPELRRLAERGLAERIGTGVQFDLHHLLLWRGERWAVGAEAFTWWVSDVVVAGVRQVSTYDEWLTKKRYRLLLTQDRWDRLVGAVRNAPGWMAQGVGSLARALLEELLRGKQR